jgi:hypothetical protein
MRRVVTGELMDAPDVPERDLKYALKYLRGVNRYLGGSRGLLRHLKPWSARWPKDRPITLLDIGTGSADIPVAARAWAAARGFDLRVTGVDKHEATIAEARDRTSNTPAIEILTGDALELDTLFAHRQFDYVHAGLFLHHLRDDEVKGVLQSMARLARVGVVWNDLVRSPMHRVLIEFAILGQPRIIRHDARRSVEAGFTKSEVKALAAECGLNFARHHPGPLFHRFTLAGERPDVGWPK